MENELQTRHLQPQPQPLTSSYPFPTNPSRKQHYPQSSASSLPASQEGRRALHRARAIFTSRFQASYSRLQGDLDRRREYFIHDSYNRAYIGEARLFHQTCLHSIQAPQLSIVNTYISSRRNEETQTRASGTQH